MEQSNFDFEEIINTGPFPMRFPRIENLGQDSEWCEVKIENNWRKIRFHDYHQVFKIPGLYETIFYRTLYCNSPARLSQLLGEVLTECNFNPRELNVLDFGAGNGMAGEALQALGTRQIIALDIIPEAKEAALRDRPWVYNDYIIEDFTQLSAQRKKELSVYNFNTLNIVAALGFGDIPTEAFINAYNLISEKGWIVFNLKEDFFKLSGKSDFSKLFNFMIQKEIFTIQTYKRYRHRLNIAGKPLYYIAIVAQKEKDINADQLKN